VPLAVACPSCSHLFRVDESFAGQTGPCPACCRPCPLTGPSVPPFDVFLSYSARDKPVADAACAVLEQGGVRCWIAPRNLTPGKDWSAGIIEGLDQSRLMVLVFSAHANRSPQVLREVERAVNRGIPILPFRIEDVKPTGGMEYLISTPHWLDAYTPPLDDRLAELNRTAVALLTASALAAPPAPPKGLGGLVGRAARALLARDNRLRVLAGLGVFLLLSALLFVLAGWALKDPKADPDTIAARAEAGQLAGRLQAVDRGQGFGPRLDEAGMALRTAEGLFDQKKFSEALAAYRRATTAAKDLLALDDQRREAAAARRTADQARAAAEEAKAQRQPAWPPALSAAEQAERRFQAAEFPAAREDWDRAAGGFRLAADKAQLEGELARYKLPFLEGLTPDLWRPVRQQQARAAALERGDPLAAADAYREAHRLARAASLPYRRYAAFWLGLASRLQFYYNARLVQGDMWPLAEELEFFPAFRDHFDRDARQALGLPKEVEDRINARLPKNERNELKSLAEYLHSSVPELLRSQNEREVVASFKAGNNVGVVRFYVRCRKYGRDLIPNFPDYPVAIEAMAEAVALARMAGFPEKPAALLGQAREVIRDREYPRYDSWNYNDSQIGEYHQKMELPHWSRLLDEFLAPLFSPEKGVPYLAGPPAPTPPAGLAAWAVNHGGSYRADADAPAAVVEVDLRQTSVNDADLAGLPAGERLRSLRLSVTEATGKGLADLAGLKSLRTLDMDSRPVGDAHLAALQLLPELRDLNLRAAGISDAGMPALARLSPLERLRLGSTRITDDGLTDLAPLKGLKELELQFTKVALADPAKVRLPPNLETLYLKSCPLERADLSILNTLLKLHELDLREAMLADAQLAPLGKMTGLRRLELGGNPITNDGLVHLAPLTALKELGLKGAKATDAGLAELCRSGSLRELNLRSTAAANDVAKALAGTGKLQVLLLGGCRQFGDAQAARLAALTELRELDLSDTPLTDVGLDRVAGLPNLTGLNLIGTKVTLGAVQKLREKRPGLRVGYHFDRYE
jgi:Leucine-rich repeat (LRR) protein